MDYLNQLKREPRPYCLTVATLILLSLSLFAGVLLRPPLVSVRQMMLIEAVMNGLILSGALAGWFSMSPGLRKPSTWLLILAAVSGLWLVQAVAPLISPA